nr:immunoglobulin heavy chain junction region [Mus musculus]
YCARGGWLPRSYYAMDY